MLGGGEHRLLAILVEQFDEAFDAKLHRSNLSLDIAQHLIRHPRIGGHEMPQGTVAYATLIELNALEQHALGKHIRHIDNQTRRGRANIDMMSGVSREADQLAFVIDRRDGGDIGRVAGAVIGVIVNAHIAGLPRGR